MAHTSESVRALIERQIAGEWKPESGHRLDLRTCLVEPKRKTMEVLVGNERRTDDLWLVLEERPGEDQRGYRIVYDEVAEEFGLAIDGRGDRLVVIGLYGDFMQTLAAM